MGGFFFAGLRSLIETNGEGRGLIMKNVGGGDYIHTYIGRGDSMEKETYY